MYCLSMNRYFCYWLSYTNFYVIAGIGYALACTLLPQILKQHFTEHISTAVGITFIGGSIGGFASIPVFTKLLDTYGVSGTLLITSGIMLHGLPVAMLLWNPKYSNRPVSKEKDGIALKDTLIEHKSFAIKPAEIEILLSSRSEPILKNREVNEFGALYINSRVKLNRTNDNEVDNTVYNGSTKQDKSIHQKSTSISLSDVRDGRVKDSEKYKNPAKSISNCIKKDIALECEKQNKYRRALKTFVIFKNRAFLTIMLCQSVHVYVVAFISTTMIDISKDKGILQSEEKFVLMLLSLAEVIGFTCLGWTTDKGYLSVSNYMAINFLLLGLSCYTFVIASNFLIFLVAVMGFGVFMCGISCVNPSMVYEYIDEKMHTMAIASRIVLFVPFSFTMGPLIGKHTANIYTLCCARCPKKD